MNPRGGEDRVNRKFLVLETKLGDRVIYLGKLRIIVYLYSPDFLSLDFSFWGQAIAQVPQSRPSTKVGMKAIVENFAKGIGEDLLSMTHEENSTAMRVRQRKTFRTQFLF